MSFTILIPAVIIGYSVYKLNKSALQDYVRVRLKQEGQRGADIMDNFFAELERKISLINLLSGANGIEKEKALPFLMDIINNRPEIRGIRLTQRGGEEISFGEVGEILDRRERSSAYIEFPEDGNLFFIFSYPLPRLGGAMSGAGDLNAVIDKITASNSLPEKIIKFTVGKKTVFKTDNYPPEKNTLFMQTPIPNLGWSLTYGQREDVALKPLRKFVLNAAILMIAVLLLSFFVARTLANNLTKPISILAESAKHFAKGDFDHAVPVGGKDEIGSLGNTFNWMAKEVKEGQQKLMDQERLAIIGRMAAVIGHELRNPLAAVSNACFFIKNRLTASDIDPKIIKHLAIMESETSRIKRIGSDMLSFARQRAPLMGPIEAKKLIEELTDTVKTQGGVEIRKNIVGEIPPAKGEYEEIKQVLTNIVENAKAAVGENGFIEISVRGGILMKKGREAENAVIISVEDNGCGIPEKIIKKIFDPFFSTKNGGTGLGLSVSKRIIEERHGGELSVKSKENKGSLFIIKLPAWKNASAKDGGGDTNER